jgi:predicted MFS family arabinose efflux permease
MIKKAIHWYVNTYRGMSREVWILSLVMFINRSGTMVLPFLTVYLTQELSFTLTQAGYVMGSFGVGSVAGSWIGGKLTDKIGYYPVQFWTLFLSGTGFFGLIFLDSLTEFCIYIFALALIADAFRPAGLAAIAAYSKTENRTRSFALVRLAINLGWAVGPAVGGILAVTVGYNWLFIVDGMTCITAALVYRSLLRPKEKETKKEAEEAPGQMIASAFRDYRYLFFLGCITLSTVGFMQLFSTIPVFFKGEYGMSEDLIGLALAANAVIIVLMEMPLVHTLEKRYRPLPLMALGVFLIGFSLLAFNLMGPTAAVVVFILAITFGEMFNMPFSNTYAVEQSTESNRGQYMALLTIAYSLAHVIAPVIGLQVAEKLGYKTLWYLLFLFSLLSLTGLWWLDRKKGKLSGMPYREKVASTG